MQSPEVWAPTFVGVTEAKLFALHASISYVASTVFPSLIGRMS